ncbi:MULTISPECIES: DUF397 domain-containing protein [unclassified Streptomyces]|uniref:DUF397 domain-containing protein n=1 Tax=unclassified Streptomyces TaxID=2593676 RepID=UPI0007DDCFC4|nr:DUF397 domain-containing protein [Streptomyces sp. SAT1]ANH92993.1 DUF397 domain-containing protein [Streptomyces sp. SAT1]
MKASSPDSAVGELRWFKSSYSAGDGGDCVEVADAGAVVLIRDSKRPEEAFLSVGSGQWAAFVRMTVRG